MYSSHGMQVQCKAQQGMHRLGCYNKHDRASAAAAAARPATAGAAAAPAALWWAPTAG